MKKIIIVITIIIVMIIMIIIMIMIMMMMIIIIQRQQKMNRYRVEYKRYINTANVIYRQTSNIRHTSAGKQIIDHSDVVGASPVGAAPTTSSFSTHLASIDWTKTNARRGEKHVGFGIWCVLY